GLARFTPTRVGTIKSEPAGLSELAVHPHARGDNQITEIAEAVWGGSPPRAWGQSRGLRAAVRPRRFTPTRVGTMSGASSGSVSRTVHPHARGDNVVQRHDAADLDGSPPRAWGQSSGYLPIEGR